MDRRILVKSAVDYKVGLMIQSYGFSRDFLKDGATNHIPFEYLFDGLSEPGVRTLFDEGILTIPNKQDRIDLGLEDEENIQEVSLPDGEVIESSIITLTENQILKILKVDSAAELKNTMEKLPQGQREKIAEIAIKSNVTDYEKTKIIQDYTRIDVISVIQRNKADKAAEVAAKE